MAQRRTTPSPTAGAARSTGRVAARSASAVRNRAGAEGQRVASRAADEAHEVASTAQEKGQELVALASRQAGELGSTVREQTARVSGEVAEQGRTLAEDARSQIEYHANAQSRRLADSLSRLGDEVQALADGRPDDAATVRPYVSDAADAVYDAADRLYGLAQDVDERGISGVLEDLQAFARRRPGTFLLGAAVAGFGLGRAVRASSDDGAAPAGALSRPR